MHMHIFWVKKPSCKILKTKSCVPLEVQYYSKKDTDLLKSLHVGALSLSRPICKHLETGSISSNMEMYKRQKHKLHTLLYVFILSYRRNLWDEIKFRSPESN